MPQIRVEMLSDLKLTSVREFPSDYLPIILVKIVHLNQTLLFSRSPRGVASRWHDVFVESLLALLGRATFHHSSDRAPLATAIQFNERLQVIILLLRPVIVTARSI